jgi:hypothetical protein
MWRNLVVFKKFVDYFRLPHVFLTLINQNSQFQISKTSAAHSGVWNANDNACGGCFRKLTSFAINFYSISPCGD